MPARPNPKNNAMDRRSQTARKLGNKHPDDVEREKAEAERDASAPLPAETLASLPSGVTDLLSQPGILAALRQKTQQAISERQLELYKPYGQQLAFHAAGKTFRERLLLASNQTGKTFCVAAETAMHATGLYPCWWQGKRFEKPTSGWVVGLTSEAVRDTMQRLLLGRLAQIGTGFIPKRTIIDTSSTRAVSDAIDTVTIRHVSGGVSSITFKAASQGREKLQGETLQYVVCDEEMDLDIYQECLTRLTATQGIMLACFTPLKGMSDMVRMFYPHPNTSDRICVRMTIDDAEHIPVDERAKIVAAYSPHERDARAKGIPMMGQGKTYPIPETDISIEAFPIPNHWAQIIGIDLGWSNTAAVKLAHDRDSDILYVVNAARLPQETVSSQAEFLRGWGKVPVAWPHDGAGYDRSSGKNFAALYRECGLDMLPEWATHEGEGGFAVEPGVQALLDRMQTGRFKVFSHLGEWWDEFRNYHRTTDGRINKAHDHLMDATRIASMMLRDANPPGNRWGSSTGPLRRNIRGIRMHG